MSETVLIFDYDQALLAYNEQLILLRRFSRKVKKNVTIVQVDQEIVRLGTLSSLIKHYPKTKEIQLSKVCLVVFSIVGDSKVLIKKGLVDSLASAIRSPNYPTRVVCLSQSKFTDEEFLQQREIFGGYMIGYSSYPLQIATLKKEVWEPLTEGLDFPSTE